jgi:Asp-tRNA(Asn)/Glu-tRNA(Gln) amidotransferase A subunit family amidase
MPRTIAAERDAERKAGKLRGPLHGIPVLLKDNIATADRMATTAGSLALVGASAPRDAFLAERLRDAGAVLLGKTNLSEWANFRSSQSSSGWSARGGQCRNPYVLDRSPCGSSSGTGAAIAADFAAIGVGTETMGRSSARPGMCSLVGLKPTLGLVSRAGIVPIAHSQDTAGPMARSVADAAALLGVLAGWILAIRPPRPPRQDRRRLHELPASRWFEGRPHRRRAHEVLRLQPRADRARRDRARDLKRWARRSSTRPTSRTSASTTTASSKSCCTSSRPT